MKVLIIGASGVVGSAAVAALEESHELIKVSRSSSPSVDITDQDSLKNLFESVGEVDAIISATGRVPFTPASALSREDVISGFYGKVLSQIDVVRLGIPYVRDSGSITVTTGITARVPVTRGSIAAMAGGALESFVMAAAQEMPRGVRLNAVSPTILEGARPAVFEFFPGFPPASNAVVGARYKRSVEGIETGRTFEID